jgi:hypothetical protein
MVPGKVALHPSPWTQRRRHGEQHSSSDTDRNNALVKPTFVETDHAFIIISSSSLGVEQLRS